MDVRIKITKPPAPCQHVVIEYMTEHGSLTRVYLLSEIKNALSVDSFEEAEQMLFGQVKRVILENPDATISQLKTMLEQEVFKV